MEHGDADLGKLRHELQAALVHEDNAEAQEEFDTFSLTRTVAFCFIGPIFIGF